MNSKIPNRTQLLIKSDKIINISNNTNDVNLKKIINFVDDNDCIVGDEFNIK